ncbi:hypothetical protein [Roseinatronobacter alkalisoli]|uniref:Uncharacterized protein n=1 Tax=Roseinatronobacter alkalisoli TaxID=3028235 RepID=A0ABT5TFG1_9RHOB|nr:hypothetical protein [Roseinatronobacter sp. HJB301]MDD7973853.1 hypothetical protein [Roseinatronobacter sp. HJB301]
MKKVDVSVFALGWLLEGYYKDHPDVQEHTIALCRAFVNFMDANGLFVTRPYEGDDPPRDLNIVESQLSPEGKVLFRSAAIDRWKGRNDDITKPISMRVLERELKKLRGK